MDYTTVFDVAESGYRQWSFAAFGLIFIAAGLAMPFFSKSGLMRSPSPRSVGVSRPFVIGFATLWTIGAFLSTYLHYRGAVNALQKGEVKIAAGLVTDYREVPHKSESFVVQGVMFQYSDYGIIAGFNNTASEGGPIRQGLPVKIWYWRGEIVRLQIKKGA